MFQCLTLHVSASHPTCLSVSPMSKCPTLHISVSHQTYHRCLTRVSASHPTCLSASPYVSAPPPVLTSVGAVGCDVPLAAGLTAGPATSRAARPTRRRLRLGRLAQGRHQAHVWGRQGDGGHQGRHQAHVWGEQGDGGGVRGQLRLPQGRHQAHVWGGRGTGGQKNTGGDREIG